MIESLFLMAQKPFLERWIAPIFCAQDEPRARDHCLRSWRRSSNCGCN